jgi:hypothetical protein
MIVVTHQTIQISFLDHYQLLLQRQGDKVRRSCPCSIGTTDTKISCWCGVGVGVDEDLPNPKLVPLEPFAFCSHLFVPNEIEGL